MPNRPWVMAMAAAVVAALGVTACAPRTSAPRTSAPRTSAPGTGAPGTGASSPGARPEPACATSQLTITLTRKGGAVTGEVGGYLRFANNGPTTCQIGGWPAVTAVTSVGKTITAARAWHGTMLGAWRYAPPLPVVRLAPGTAVYAVLAAGDHSARTTRPCPPVRWLRVNPPAGSGHVTLSARLYDHVYLPACTSFRGTTEIQFSAVVPLTDLPH
jgi:Protein of unknown function (DUF4232)